MTIGHAIISDVLVKAVSDLPRGPHQVLNRRYRRLFFFFEIASVGWGPVQHAEAVVKMW